MIEFDTVALVYRGAGTRVRAIDGVSLQVRESEIVAVLGANGSGKSTLVRLANGLLRPDEGTVCVDGIDTRDDDLAFELRSTVGVVFQDPDNQIVATSVEEEVAFGPENLGLERAEIRDRVTESLAAVGLTGLESREPHTLSGGQKQRLAIAGALAMRPRHLVLDEPTSMLDPVGRRDIVRIVRELRDRGVGVMLVTHHVEEAASADRVVVLAAGRVAFDGTWSDLASDAARIERLGLDVPPALELADALRAHGVRLEPGVVAAADIVGAL